jgi:hypothetical protein
LEPLGGILRGVDEERVRQELEATVEARRELGPSHDRELVDGFLERIEKEIDRRVDERLARQRPQKSGGGMVLHPANLGVCIPLVVLAGVFGGPVGVVAICVALVFIFGIASRR